MSNTFARLVRLLDTKPRQVGTVIAGQDGTWLIELPSGSTITAVGEATIGQQVFFAGGAIEGPAPSLPIDVITI